MGVMLRDAMQIQPLRQARLVAGKFGLDNQVDTVTVLESPEIVHWVRGKELILTSLYAIKDQPAVWKGLIGGLSDRGCAGLVVKTGRYVPQIPDEILGLGDQLGFPVIELPTQIRYVDVITPLMELILTTKASLLRHSNTTHRSLTQVVLSGGGLASIAEVVAEHLACRVVILDRGLRNMGTDAAVDQASLSEWLEVHDPLSDIWRGFDKDLLELTGPEGVGCIGFPIWAGREVLGFLVMWPMQPPMTQGAIVVIEHAVTVAALELLKHRAIQQVERRYHDEVLSDLVQGRVETEADLLQRARHLDWNLGQRYRIMLFDMSFLSRGLRTDALRQMALDAAMRVMSGPPPRPIVGYVQSALLVLLPEARPIYLQSDLEGLARAIQHQVSHSTEGPRPSVGLSEQTAGLLGLKPLLVEAQDAAELGSLIKGDGAVSYFSQLGVYRLFRDCREGLREEFIRSVLGPIIDQDQQKNSQLLETVESYLEADGHLKTVAERMFIHVNTVKYRLHQVEDLTGHSVETSEGRLNLSMALKLRDLSGARRGGPK